MFGKTRVSNDLDVTSGTRLAQIEFNSLTAVTWPLLALYCGLSVFSAEESIQFWQTLFLIGLCTSYIGTLILGKIGISTYKFLPILFYILVAPIALGDTPSSPWMSYGLVSIAAVLSLSNLRNIKLSIFTMIIICGIQNWAIRSDLTSINDKRDLLLLNSYFSTLWTLGVGLAVLFIRTKYLAKSSEIDNDIEIIESQTMQTYAQINRLNRSDSKNLQLHGTILNTLIYAAQNLGFQRDRNAFRGQLLTELEQFENSSSNRSLLLNLQEMIASLQRPNFSIRFDNLPSSSQELSISNVVLEIAREMLLNISKHTSATKVHLSIVESADKNIHISVRDDSTLGIDRKSANALAEMGYHSYSLNRLLSSVNGTLKISINDQNETVKDVVVPTTFEIQSIRKTLNAKRLESVQYLSRNLIGGVIIYSGLCIPGYLLLGSDLRVISLLTLELIMITWLYIRKISPNYLRYLSIFVTLSIFPAIALLKNSCQELLITPWIYNSLLGSVFYFALVARNKYERWLPLAIYFLQSLLIPLYFPADCQGLLAGSLPGAPLIVLFAILIFRIRDRASQQDEARLMSTFNDKVRLDALERELIQDRSKLLNSIRDFAESLIKNQSSTQSLDSMIRLCIAKVRNFLISSEFYESTFIRNVYRLIEEQNEPNRVISLKLYGSSFPDELLPEKLNLIQERIRGSKKDLEISIFNQSGLEINFY